MANVCQKERVNLLNMKEQCVELESQLEEERRSLFVHHEGMYVYLYRPEDDRVTGRNEETCIML